MSDWEAYGVYIVQLSEWRIRRLILSGRNFSVEEIELMAAALQLNKAGLAEIRQIWAERKTAAAAKEAEQRARDAAEYAEEHDDDYVQAMDEYFDEHNDELLSVPVAGTILQELLKPVFEAFKATPKTTAEAVPVGHSMPESPNGEPLAAVSIRTLLGPDDTNSSKF